MTIVLASSSPRRIELMRRIGLDCIVDPPDIDEEAVELNIESAGTLSELKAKAVALRHDKDAVVVAADTVVVCGGTALGKPKDEEEALAMLRLLAGRTHMVATGVTVRQGSRSLTRTELTEVTMRSLTDGEIRAYIATGEPMDKAGAYGIQERGALLVERVEGDFYNVMGLPVCLFSKILKSFGVDLLC